jgi:hypothetical protein
MPAIPKPLSAKVAITTIKAGLDKGLWSGVILTGGGGFFCIEHLYWDSWFAALGSGAAAFFGLRTIMVSNDAIQSLEHTQTGRGLVATSGAQVEIDVAGTPVR